MHWSRGMQDDGSNYLKARIACPGSVRVTRCARMRRLFQHRSISRTMVRARAGGVVWRVQRFCDAQTSRIGEVSIGVCLGMGGDTHPDSAVTHSAGAAGLRTMRSWTRRVRWSTTGPRSVSGARRAEWTSCASPHPPRAGAAVEGAHVQSIMCSYNAINGVPAVRCAGEGVLRRAPTSQRRCPQCANSLFMNDVARGQWQFDGALEPRGQRARGAPVALRARRAVARPRLLRF